MTLQKSIELLERYNRWRKGADVQMPLPSKLPTHAKKRWDGL
jgi:hypothetical protein